MNKEILQQSIDRMKEKYNALGDEISNMEAKLNESDKVVLEYKEGCYLVESGCFISALGNGTKYKQHARYRDTEAQAEETLLRELQANRIEALARKLEPDWKANWRCSGQYKYYIAYCVSQNRYCVYYNSITKSFGIPYMSKETPETICDYLNDGRYSLDMED